MVLCATCVGSWLLILGNLAQLIGIAHLDSIYISQRAIEFRTPLQFTPASGLSIPLVFGLLGSTPYSSLKTNGRQFIVRTKDLCSTV